MESKEKYLTGEERINMANRDFANLLEKLRESLNQSVTEFADTLDVTRAELSKVLNARQKPGKKLVNNAIKKLPVINDLKQQLIQEYLLTVLAELDIGLEPGVTVYVDGMELD